MADKNKVTLGSDALVKITPQLEVEILKKIFKGNEQFLLDVRNLLYGLPVSDTGKKAIKKTFSNADHLRVFRKKLYPIFNQDMMDMPVNSIADFWYGTEDNVLGHSRDMIYQNIQSKMKVKSYFETAIELLQNPDGTPIDLSFTPSISDDLQINLIARNLYIRSVVNCLNFMRIVCEQDEPTTESTKKKRDKDSVE